MKDFLAPTPSVRQPLFETSDNVPMDSLRAGVSELIVPPFAQTQSLIAGTHACPHASTQARKHPGTQAAKEVGKEARRGTHALCTAETVHTHTRPHARPSAPTHVRNMKRKEREEAGTKKKEGGKGTGGPTRGDKTKKTEGERKIHAKLGFQACMSFLRCSGPLALCHFNKENPGASWNATLSSPSMPSHYANSYLVPISFWMLTIPWTFREPISFYKRVSRF